MNETTRLSGATGVQPTFYSEAWVRFISSSCLQSPKGLPQILLVSNPSRDHPNLNGHFSIAFLHGCPQTFVQNRAASYSCGAG